MNTYNVAEDCVLQVGADVCADKVDDLEEEGLGAEGRGHVMSVASVDFAVHYIICLGLVLK